MKDTTLTYLEKDTADSIQSKSLLHADGVDVTVLQIAPGGSTPAAESAVPRVLVVGEGQATISDALTNVVLSADEAFQVQPGRKVSIRNSGGAPAKVFVVEIPARRREPELVVM